jgi:hypothetical protein
MVTLWFATAVLVAVASPVFESEFVATKARRASHLS